MDTYWRRRFELVVIKNISIVDPQDKGNGIRVDPLVKEMKRLEELKVEKLRQLNSILRQRKDDPLGLNKGD